MTLLLDGSDEVVHGILGAMRFVSTAGATRPFEGPSAELVNAMAQTFESARHDLSISGSVLEAAGTWSSTDLALSELTSALVDDRSRHEAMVAATLCVLMADDFDPAGEHALRVLADAFGVDQEAASLIEKLSRSSCEIAGGDLFRRFLAERSDDSLEVITSRLDRLEDPLITPTDDYESYVRLLQGAPEGSVGSEMLRFYRHTGYDVPGAPGVPALEVLGPHDLHHVLAGYSTSNIDEVAIAMFTAANSTDGGLYYLAVVLLQWHHDVKISPFEPSSSVLTPSALAAAAARGAMTSSDLSDRSWDWASIMTENLGEVRRELGVVPGGTVADGGAWDARGRGDA
jgi:hypothetical protein